MDDLRIVAARLWDLLGRKPVSSKELTEALYANLRWFPPTQAEHVVGMLQSAKLLQPGPTDGSWVASPEVQRMEVPLTYRPPTTLSSVPLVAAPTDLLSRILEEVARGSKEDVGALRAETMRSAESLGITPEVAALLVGRRRGLALPELRDQVDRRLRGEAPAR